MGISVYCGEKWYNFHRWVRYPLVRKLPNIAAFSVGPIIFFYKK